MTFDPVSVKYVFAPIQSKFEGMTFPIPTFPLVFKKRVKMFPFTNKTFEFVSENHTFEPIVRVFEGELVVPIETFPYVTKEFPVFVKITVPDVEFPKVTI
jgi:hypothetical protein